MTGKAIYKILYRFPNASVVTQARTLSHRWYGRNITEFCNKLEREGVVLRNFHVKSGGLPFKYVYYNTYPRKTTKDLRKTTRDSNDKIDECLLGDD